MSQKVYFLVTCQAAERETTEEKDDFWSIAGSFAVIRLHFAVSFTYRSRYVCISTT